MNYSIKFHNVRCYLSLNSTTPKGAKDWHFDIGLLLAPAQVGTDYGPLKELKASIAAKRGKLMATMQRKFGLFIAFCILLMAPSAWALNPPPLAENYQRLFDLIQLDDLETPLVLFLDQKDQFDRNLNQENLAYLNQNQDLLEQIKSHFQGDSLNWKLANSYKRLLVVPENRVDYADLFERYCDEVVAFTLSATQLPNPIKLITTLKEPLSEFHGTSSDQGVTAYLVHNIADEYIEEYHFFDHADQSQKIQIKLSNLEFSGHIGSYNSDIVIGEDGQFKFIHNTYTLWQNSAKDPLNVFVAPVEETLHMALRSATEIAIQERLKQLAPKAIDEVQKVVDEWMAVEEAIVGGLVSELMPQIFTRFLGGPLTSQMNQSLSNRHAHTQYRYLQNGIRIVTDLGLQPAIDLYTSEPQKFKQLVTS